jgi:hypothetical protein
MPRRPRSVTWLALAVLLLSAVNLLRAVRVFLGAEYLAQLNLSVSPAYLGASGLVWGTALGAAAIGLWGLRSWGRWLALGGVGLYHLQAWINRLAFDTSTYARQGWPWEAVASVLGVGLTWGVLWWPGVRAAFEQNRSKG